MEKNFKTKFILHWIFYKNGLILLFLYPHENRHKGKLENNNSDDHTLTHPLWQKE